MAGNTNKVVTRLKKTRIAACNENTRRAGIGIIVAAKNAPTLLNDVSRTLRPPFFNTMPVCSCEIKSQLETRFDKMNEQCCSVGYVHQDDNPKVTVERTRSLKGTYRRHLNQVQDMVLSVSER